MNFSLEGRNIVVMGVANKRSIAQALRVLYMKRVHV